MSYASHVQIHRGAKVQSSQAKGKGKGVYERPCEVEKKPTGQMLQQKQNPSAPGQLVHGCRPWPGVEGSMQCESTAKLVRTMVNAMVKKDKPGHKVSCPHEGCSFQCVSRTKLKVSLGKFLISTF